MNTIMDEVEARVQDHRHHINRGKDCSKLSTLDYPLKHVCKSKKSNKSKLSPHQMRNSSQYSQSSEPLMKLKHKLMLGYHRLKHI